MPVLFLRSAGAGKRFWEFFTANCAADRRRRLYRGARPRGVEADRKQHLAATRMLFDWLVTGEVTPLNPAHSVRGPRHSVKKGKTSVLSAEEMRQLLDSIEATTLIGLRDRALIALMGYTFAGVGAAVQMKVEDYYIQKRRGWVRLHEKGGKVTELPCHDLEQFLDEWLAAPGLTNEPGAPLFPALRHGKLTGRQPFAEANVHLMIQRRARAAGIRTKISAHSFRATGITTVSVR